MIQNSLLFWQSFILSTSIALGAGDPFPATIDGVVFKVNGEKVEKVSHRRFKIGDVIEISLIMKDPKDRPVEGKIGHCLKVTRLVG